MTTPAQAFVDALQSLHTRAGGPSSRAIARAVGSVSHTTVNDTLTGRRVPSWPVVESIVDHLGCDDGDLVRLHALWAATRPRALASVRRATSGDILAELREVNRRLAGIAAHLGIEDADD